MIEYLNHAKSMACLSRVTGKKGNSGLKKMYVYILKAGPFLKIGHAANIEKRIEQMQTGCPYEITVLAKMPFKTRRGAMDYERELHNRCRKYHFRGEWFYQEAKGIVFYQNGRPGKPRTKHADIRWDREN